MNDSSVARSSAAAGASTAMLGSLLAGTEESPGASVIRDGRLLVEEYFNGATRDTLHDTRSVGKSFASTMMGIAIDDGYIKSENQTLKDFYDLRKFANYSAQKEGVSLKSLLTMSSAFDGNDDNEDSPGNEEKMYPTGDWIKFALDLPMDQTRAGANEVEVEFSSGDEALNRDEEFLYTLFVPARAQLAFPCFDQPDLKARYALSLLQERSAFPRPLALAARPLAAAADAVAARLRPNRFLGEESEFSEDALDPAMMLAHLPDVLHGNALQPLYDAHTLAWLLDQAARKTFYGTLRARAVLDA